MSSGFFIVAYGKEYDKCAAYAWAFSRRFTGLPLCVVTNLKPEERCSKWKDVKNVEFKYFQKEQKENRRPKLGMDLLTPYDKTLYMDADCVIQKPGVEVFERLLDENDAIFNWRITFNPGEKIWNIYARCMKQFGIEKPISIYNGGLIAFKKMPAVRELFTMWQEFWVSAGRGREMAPLNCAIKKTGIQIGTFPLLYFADAGRNDNVIIQHNYNNNFCERFGIPKWTEYKPFDNGRADDFRFEKVAT